MANSVVPPKRLAKEGSRRKTNLSKTAVKKKGNEQSQPASLQSNSFISQLESLCETQSESLDDSREDCPIVNIPTALKTRDQSTGMGGSSDGAVIIRLLTNDLWSDDEELVGRGLTRLTNMCSPGDVGSGRARKNATALFQAGGHLAIVQSMKKHTGSSKLQEQGCRAIQNVAFWNEGGSKLLLGAIGGIEAVVNAMRDFPEDEGVQDRGCWAIANLIFGEKDNVRLVTALEGIPVIISSMKAFPENESLQRASCQCVKSICKKVRARKLLRSEGAVKTVAAAYMTHTEESGVREIARDAMKELLVLK